MCGIFGYVGRKNASTMIIQGLKRLEYRGYDSWGVAVVADNRAKRRLTIMKQVGAIGDLADVRKLPVSHRGIGHTRWATHGGVTWVNAHPHVARDRSFVLAQNGIVENYQELKKRLRKRGHRFATQTDTEVIVRLVEEKQKRYPILSEAVRRAFLELEGRNTIIVMATKEGEVIAVRHGSPLVVGVGNDEYFFASDTLSFADQTDRVVLIKDRQFIKYRQGKLTVHRVKTGRLVATRVERLDHGNVTVDKKGYPHFMIKEIVEQQQTIRDAIQYTEEELKPLTDALVHANRVFTVGAGTASCAAGQIAYFCRRWGELPVVELKAYEIESWLPIMEKGDLLLAVSQSGETADTLDAVAAARKKGVKIASLVNMVGSTLPRLSDWAFYTRSGPEICVASTKAFTAQLAWGLVVAKTVAGQGKAARQAVLALADRLSGYFTSATFGKIRALAQRLKDQDHWFILGKGQHYYIALEAALKIKEIAYKQVEGLAAGELKHGVIALVEPGTPVFVMVGKDQAQADMLAAAAEVKSRGALVIGVSSRPNGLFSEWFRVSDAASATSIGAIIPFQLLAYFLGVELGCDPDKPRNLAKSVTVK